MLLLTPLTARRLELVQTWRGVWYARAQQRLRPELKVEVMEIAGGFMVYAGPASPLNRAVGLGLTGEVSPADLAAVIQFFSSRGETPRVDLCPLADRSLVRLLAQSAFTVESFYQVFARSPAEPLPRLDPPPGMLVRLALPAEADLWIRTTAQGFTGVEEPEAEVLDLLGPNFHSQNGMPFMAWIDGQPAGGGGMYLHDGVAEFGGASTRPAYRHRGVQTALIAARLQAARERGCDLVVVVTRPGSDSQRNVLRCGFELAYTKVVLEAIQSIHPIQIFGNCSGA